MPDFPRPSGPVGPAGPAPRRKLRSGPVAAFTLGIAVAAGAAAGTLILPYDGGLASALPAPAPDRIDLGFEWSPAMVGAEAVYREAVDGLGLTVAALGLLTALVALAAAGILLATRGTRRRRELAVRGALGRGPAALARLLLRRDGALLSGGLALGVLAGAAAAALLHVSWPVERSGGGIVPAAPALAALGIAVALAGGLALGLTLLPARYGARGLSRSLAAGTRASADPREGGLRRVATVLQTVVSLALLSGSVLLWKGLPATAGPNPAADGDVTLLSARPADASISLEERAVRYAAFLEELGTLPTVASESIASPGAWGGVATSDVVLADCGNCRRGVFWLPFLSANAPHYAVSPRFFESVGMELLEGRGFSDGDGPGSERVAIVTEPLARSHFEGGDAVGRHLRVGEGLESWYRVVGVVREDRPPGLALPDEPGPGVYLSVLQHPPDRVDVGFRGAARDVRTAAARAGLGIGPAGRSAASVRRAGTVPLRWAAAVAGVLGTVAFLSALLGVHRVAAVEVAARRRELGVRLALGATSRGLTRWVLARTLRSTLLGALLAVPLTIAITARMREAMGDIPLFDPVSFTALAGLVVATALAGARGPAREAARLEPGLVMSEE